MATRAEAEALLTQAARQALDELVDDYRGQLLLGAANSAARFGDLREVSVHDILAAVSRQQTRALGRASRFDRILWIYLLFGSTLGVSVLAALTAKLLASSQSEPLLRNLLPAMIALGGFLLSAFVVWTWRSRRTADALRRGAEFGERDAIALYLSRWREIELALRGAAS